MNLNFNNSEPAAPTGSQNVSWQADQDGNLSAYVPVSSGSGASFTLSVYCDSTLVVESDSDGFQVFVDSTLVAGV